MKKIIIVSLSAVNLCGCSHTLPVSAVLVGGKVYHGTTTAALSGGTFEISGTDGLSCQGTYNAFDVAKTINATATCSDGRTAVVTATRDPAVRMGGAGTIVLSDGTKGEFAFGDNAKRF